MKKARKRVTAVLLATAMTAALAVGQLAFASPALGTELVDQMTELAPGVTLVDGSLWSATFTDLRSEHYVTYTPGSGVDVMLFSGTYVASTNTVASAAAQMEAEGYRVVAGVNGGFFNNDGTIVGMLLTDGVLRSVDVLNYTLVGIREDGSVFVDESKITKKAFWDGEEHTVDGFNAYRTTSGLYLYNQDFSSKVNSGGPCVCAILRPVQPDGLTMNSSLVMEVESVTDTFQEGVEFNGTLPEGCYMLYAEKGASEELLEQLRGLEEGQQVTISVEGGSDEWADAVYGLSAMETLVRDGAVVSGLPSGANPRTAIGLKDDGSVILYTIDGRQDGYSVGATYTQVAERLLELGCDTAVALDGGGSTTLGATMPGSSRFELVNRPSSDSRRLNNCILLLASGQPTGIPAGYAVTAEEQVVLSGSSIAVEAVAYDTAGYPLDETSPVWSAAGGTIEGTAGGGGIYTAGDTAGTYVITAAGGGQQGTCTVRVVEELSSLTVSRKDSGAQVDQLILEPGETVELAVSGSWYNLPAAMDGDVTWSADAAIGTVDENGVFTAAGNNAQGTILVSAGGRTVNVAVKVDRGDPFTDMGSHWASDYVTQLYKLGITNGFEEADGSYTFRPAAEMSRGELLVFLARLLNVDTQAYETVILPFADADSIAGWMLPSVKALYALQIFEGSGDNGALYANVGNSVTREEAMTMMGRVLAGSDPYDLSVFLDGANVSGWASSYVQTLVARGVVQGSDGYLSPRDNISRGEAAKLLAMIYSMDKNQFTQRPGLEFVQEPAEA